ncbi:MvdC/MvdD family ATP grasp protein [Teredinibacter turnerae]|uniref:MvdC/MvdD family ATP grasp protein n=1 Tax=Teredinibacter turnerae TaxID=2426 RepID=UPI00040D83BD|nr:hypothetical protein [Teredinibacter turnerae]
MSNSVLVITSKEDVTVDFVIDKLKTQNVDYYRFNTEDIGSHISIFFDGWDYSLFDKLKKTRIEANNYDAIYFRRPKLPAPLNSLTPGEKHFYLTEITTYLEGLYRSLLEKFWLNSVFDIRMLENKPYQLNLAKKIGFDIPELIISNDFGRCKRFISSHNKCVFKPLKTGLIEEQHDTGKILYTTKVDDNFLLNMDSHGAMPLYIQQEIEKECDVRVTVVGDKLFAAKIISQEDEISKVDWRRSETMLSHERLNLPDSLQNKCMTLCQVSRLNFAAIDFVLDKNGVFWFLEINPNGQWAWIESLLDYPISDEIAALLAHGRRSYV